MLELQNKTDGSGRGEAVLELQNKTDGSGRVNCAGAAE